MTADAAADCNRLAEIYRQKSDDELEIIADDAYDLTDIAREVLTAEIQSRRLPFNLSLNPPDVESDTSEYGPVDDTTGYELRSLYTAESYEEATKLKKWFDDSGIATFIGDANVQELEKYVGKSNEIELKVRDEDWGRAVPCLRALMPDDVSKNEDEEDELILTSCPACHSKDVTFLCKDPLDREKFRWRCNGCNLTWIDDGVVK